jgi:uncharacterized protein YggE
LRNSVRAASVIACGAVLGSGGFASGAAAQQPATTLTASGSAQVKPEPQNRRSEASIRRAVDAANAEALPKAVADARGKAADLAAAAGLRLGPLVSISDAPANGFPFYFPQNGTFGNGRFCGAVRNRRTVVRNGVPRRVPARGTHRVCRVPSQVVTSVSLTFSVTAGP